MSDSEPLIPVCLIGALSRLGLSAAGIDVRHLERIPDPPREGEVVLVSFPPASPGEEVALSEAIGKGVPLIAVVPDAAAMDRFLSLGGEVSIREGDFPLAGERLIRSVHEREKETLSWSRQRGELEIFNRIATALISTLELPQVLDLILETVQPLIRAEAWSLLLYNEEQKTLHFEIATGPGSQKLKKIVLRLGEGVAGWVARERLPLIVNDPRSDSRFNPSPDKSIGFSSRSILALPLISHGRLLGVLEIINKEGLLPFNEQDQETAGRLADLIAIAIDRATLYQKTVETTLIDDLTGAFNSRFLTNQVPKELRRAERFGFEISLIFLDLDHFKEVNDDFGHLVGSRCLVDVAKLFLGNLREMDLLARYGGDEFVAVLPHTNLEMAGLAADRLRRKLFENPVIREGDRLRRISASFGVSSFPSRAPDFQTLIHQADRAMYFVKNNGRDGVCLFGETMEVMPRG
jgi:diguanylate cyclase (GGDEF)-like protein